MKKLIFLLITLNCYSQSISLNEENLINRIRLNQLKGELDTNYSFNIRPIEIGNFGLNFSEEKKETFFFPKLASFFSDKAEIRLLPINTTLEYNSHHSYNRNNGSMIPNRGYQHRISFGFFSKIGPLTIQINPEHLYSENKNYDGFWEGHYPIIWAKRYNLWNHIDIPERFGENSHNQFLIGQSLKLNLKVFFRNI